MKKESLKEAGNILAIGALAARTLFDEGQVTLFIGLNGEVELAKKGEVELDSMEELKSINTLKERNYSDEDLILYLKGRDARKNE